MEVWSEIVSDPRNPGKSFKEILRIEISYILFTGEEKGEISINIRDKQFEEIMIRKIREAVQEIEAAEIAKALPGIINE